MLCLDYRKAFDSCDFMDAVCLLRQLGTPAKAVSLLEYQWKHHRRWIEYGSHVHAKPVANSLGLPQGDPWSPICMALILSLPRREVREQLPAAGTLLYLDDRTIVGSTLADLNQAQKVWLQMEQVSRLRIHEGKTKLVARIPTAKAELRWCQALHTKP